MTPSLQTLSRLLFVLLVVIAAPWGASAYCLSVPDLPPFLPGNLYEIYMTQDRGSTQCNLNRKFYFHLPSTGNVQTDPTPVVYDLHPSETAAPFQETQSGTWQKYSDQYGFISIQPNAANVRTVDGMEGGGIWNAGPACCPPTNSDYPTGCGAVDDVSNIVNFLDLINLYPGVCIDFDRIHVQGFSNGAEMAERLLCDKPDLFASAASDAGNIAYWKLGDQDEIYDCHTMSGDDDNRAAQLITFHGYYDDIVIPEFWEPTLDYWVGDQTKWPGDTVNLCGSPVTYEEQNISYSQWSDCALPPATQGQDNVRLGQGYWNHCWPNPYDPSWNICESRSQTEGVYTSEIFWEFFEDHPLPAIEE